MKILLLINCFLGLFLSVFAQEPEQYDKKKYVDSLNTIINGKYSDSLKSRALYNLSDYYSSMDTIKRRKLIEQAKVVGAKYPYLNALYYFYEGLFYFRRNGKVASNAFYKSATLLSTFKITEAYRYCAIAWFNYAVLNEPTKGGGFFIKVVIDKAIPFADKSKDASIIGHFNSQIGDLFINNNQYDKAILYSKRAVEILEPKFPSAEVLFFSYLSLNSGFAYQGNLREAKKNLDKAFVIVKPYPKSTLNAYYLNGEGLYYIKKQDFGRALISLNKGLDIAKLPNQIDLQNMLLLRKYEALEQSKQYADAKKILELAVSNGAIKESMLSRKSIYYELAKTNAHLGLMSDAYKWSVKYQNVNDSINNMHFKQDLNALETKFRTAENQKKIFKLEAEKQRAELSAKNNRLMIWLFASLAVFLLILVPVILRYYQNKNKLISASAILEGEERERRRLARDLHDSLGGMLSGIKLGFSNWAQQHQQHHDSGFKQILNQLDGSVNELRRIARNMMPETLLKFGLEAALKDLCDSLSVGGLSITYQPININKNMKLGAQLTIFRIIQELLSNAVKHASAKNILVQCSQNADQFYITVEDDGKGLDTNQVKENKGLGLNNIDSRVKYLNGKMEISSDKQSSGTSINIELNVAA